MLDRAVSEAAATDLHSLEPAVEQSETFKTEWDENMERKKVELLVRSVGIKRTVHGEQTCFQAKRFEKVLGVSVAG